MTLTPQLAIAVSMFWLTGAALPLQAHQSLPGTARTPQVERITDNVFRVGAAVVDTQARTVTCRGAVNMDLGAVEYLAVAPHGKTHESLLRINVRPLHLQVALLMLDLEPKNILKFQGDPTTPQGDPVEIRIRWRDGKGTERTVRAEEWLQETPARHSMPPNQWVFTGSRVLKEGFEADLSKSLVAVYHDPAAILDNPLPGGAANSYIVFAGRVPKHGTPVELIFHAGLGVRPVKSTRNGSDVHSPAEVARGPR